MSMLVVVAYDVNTEDPAGRRRLRRVARACKDYGLRAQKSVFECVVDPKRWLVLRDRLIREMDKGKDSLRFYFLDESAKKKIEHIGVSKPIDLEDPLVI